MEKKVSHEEWLKVMTVISEAADLIYDLTQYVVRLEERVSELEYSNG